MEHLSTHADGLSFVGGADRADHELLESDRGVGVGATVDDVHHRNREDIGVGTADVAIQRKAHILGGSFGNGQGNTQDGVGTQVALGRGTVQFDHGLINGALLQGRHADDCRSNLVVDVGNSLEDTLATVALGIAVTEFEGLVLTRRSTRRNSCYTDNTRLEDHFGLNRRIASGVEDFPTSNLYNSHFL